MNFLKIFDQYQAQVLLLKNQELIEKEWIKDHHHFYGGFDFDKCRKRKRAQEYGFIIFFENKLFKKRKKRIIHFFRIEISNPLQGGLVSCCGNYPNRRPFASETKVRFNVKKQL